MPILEQPDEYVVALTYRCNWNCPYCAVRNGRDQRKDAENDIMKRISMIPDGVKVTLTGGEPGMMEKNVLENILDVLQAKNETLWLETNGLFLEKYPDLVSRFHEVLYHCTEDIEASHITRYSQFGNIRYLVVVTDANMGRLDDLVETNPDIRFDFVPASYPYEKTGPELSRRNRYDVVFRFKDHMTEESIRRMLKDKDFDRIKYLM